MFSTPVVEDERNPFLEGYIQITPVSRETWDFSVTGIQQPLRVRCFPRRIKTKGGSPPLHVEYH